MHAATDVRASSQPIANCISTRRSTAGISRCSARRSACTIITVSTSFTKFPRRLIARRHADHSQRPTPKGERRRRFALSPLGVGNWELGVVSEQVCYHAPLMAVSLPPLTGGSKDPPVRDARVDTDSTPDLRVASEALAALGAAADRHVIARAMRIGLWTWPSFTALDAYMCYVAYPGAPFSRFVIYR